MDRSVRLVVRRISLATFCLSIAACGTQPDEVDLAQAISTAEQGIQGGYSDSMDSAVVGIVSLGGGGLGTCSGTLIAPNVVLTAQHCVAPTLNQVQGGVDCSQTRFGGTHAPSDLYVTTVIQLTQNPNDYHAVMEIVVPPGFDFCGRDVALMVLASPVDSSEAHPITPRVDTEMGSGDEYYAIGYGATDDYGRGSGARRRRDDLSVFCVGNECPYFYSSTNTEWIGEAGVCQGDSGGPALDLQNRVVGVASRGSYDCGNPVYGYVRGWGDWLKEQVRGASTKAGLSPPLWAQGWPTDPIYNYSIGAVCKTASDCESGLCVNGYCTRKCVAEAPCPLGFECQDVTNQCVAIPVEKEVESEAGGCAAMGKGASPESGLAWFGLMGTLLFFRRRRSHSL